MKKVIATTLLTIVCFLLQTTLFQEIQLANVAPNLLLIITVSFAYTNGREYGMLTGFFCGLLTDMVFGSVIGVCAGIFMVLGYLVGYANKFYYSEDFAAPLLLMAFSDFIYGFLYYMFMFLLRGRLHFLYYLRRIIIPEIVYTVLVGVVLYKFIHWLNGKLTIQPEDVTESA